MRDKLHYPGDRRAFDPNDVMGADAFGAFYTVSAATYDAETDVTELTLKPIIPDELQARRDTALAQLAAAGRIRNLFGTA